MPRAIFSEDQQYRYTLRRDASPTGTGTLLFLMLNPSTADEVANDPTVTRCIRYARDWGFKRLFVANIFALRSTDPAKLLLHPEPIGLDNDRWIRTLAGAADQVVGAWGAHAAVVEREPQILELLRGTVDEIYCLEKSAAGHPRHPLYMPASLKPQLWRSLKTQRASLSRI